MFLHTLGCSGVMFTVYTGSYGNLRVSFIEVSGISGVGFEDTLQADCLSVILEFVWFSRVNK